MNNNVTEEQKNSDKWTPIVSVVANIVILVIFGGILMWALNNQNISLLAVSAGGLGGLVHEFAQSKGKILYIQSYKDGLYLGSISGIILGAVAGVLLLQNLITGETTGTTNLAKASFDAFVAGLALKGIVEATTSNPQPQ